MQRRVWDVDQKTWGKERANERWKEKRKERMKESEISLFGLTAFVFIGKLWRGGYLHPKTKSLQSLLSAQQIYCTGAQPVGSLKCKAKTPLQR